MNPKRWTTCFRVFALEKFFPAKDELNWGRRKEVDAILNCYSLITAQVVCVDIVSRGRGCRIEEIECCSVFFAGSDGKRLCSPTFPISPEGPAGPRTLVLLPTSQHDSLLLLQKCCEHLLPHHILLISQNNCRSKCESEHNTSLWIWNLDSCQTTHVNLSLSSFVPTDVCCTHLLVSVLLWILRFSHDWPVVSYLLQPDVLRLPTTHHWHSGQRRVSRDSPTSTSALCERSELWGARCFFVFVPLSVCAVKHYIRTVRI